MCFHNIKCNERKEGIEMKVFEVGRVCIKNSGRDASKRCVVTKILDKNFVEVLCSGRKKKRKCNISHLEPLSQMIQLGNKKDDEILAML